MSSKHLFRASFFFLSTLAFMTPAFHSADAQASSPDGRVQITFHLHSLTRADTTPTDPVKIIKFTIEGKEIPWDTPVLLDRSWKSHIEIIVQNKSLKPIVKGGLLFSFPESGDGTKARPIDTVGLQLGRIPRHAYLRKDGTEIAIPANAPQPQEIFVSPGSSMTFSSNSADTPANDANYPPVAVSKVDVRLDSFYFSDESKWLSGDYWLAVPPPQVWQRAPATDFVGDAAIASR